MVILYDRVIHRIFYTVITMRKKEQRKKAIEQYYALRIAIVTDAERTELDISEGQYDFNISTFMVLMGTGIYISIEYGLSFCVEFNPHDCSKYYFLRPDPGAGGPVGSVVRPMQDDRPRDRGAGGGDVGPNSRGEIECR